MLNFGLVTLYDISNYNTPLVMVSRLLVTVGTSVLGMWLVCWISSWEKLTYLAPKSVEPRIFSSRPKEKRSREGWQVGSLLILVQALSKSLPYFPNDSFE